MGSCAAPLAKGDDKFITTDYLQQCQISCQLKLIRFTGESAIAFSLLSGQKVNGHIGLPA
ncbi:hypothetical protein ACTMME_20520, partial [Escherichia coli]